jgi:polyhydroxyalkanoate synthesis regulator phasin
VTEPVNDFDALKQSCEEQIQYIARQLAHNTMDQDAALACVEHELRSRIAVLEKRVEKLEEPK